MIYLDANVFIFPILTQDTRKSMACKEILEKVVDGKLNAATSALTWDEIVWATRKYLGAADSIEEGKKFMEFPNLRLIETNESTLIIANKLMERNKLKPRDALHAATAIANNAEGIISGDSDFDNVKELKRFSIEKFAKYSGRHRYLNK
ncbi:MAG: type II toxin-antitoxin system VapC family toxin [Candidatus Aenigmarchaeota archaeon]|nr:type II toxin-antitoxin system VapC family toxin [Candidatus Aenigmarchaeota archaeon]